MPAVPVVEVTDRLRRAQDDLTPAERRVGELLARVPQLIAFATVAEVASRADTGGATVVRFANKLGYEGYRELQAAVQSELTDRLRPAVERIGRPAPDDLVGRTLAAAHEGMAAALDQLTPVQLDRLVRLLTDQSHAVWLVAGDASTGLMASIAQQFAMLRPGIRTLAGTPVAVARDLAEVEKGDVLIALDLRRYDRWVIDAVNSAAGSGATVVALTDGPLSPLAAHADVALFITAASSGPFDSYLAALAVLEVLVAATATASSDKAAPRLARIEDLWRDHHTLLQP